MRISDWSSGVCSSDLPLAIASMHLSPVKFSISAWKRSPTAYPTPQFLGTKASRPRWIISGQIEPSCSRIISLRLIKSNIVVRSPGSVTRSEEHTSELQSLMRISYAVFCLKKKTKNYNYQHKAQYT